MNELTELLNELKNKKLSSKTPFGHYTFLAGSKAQPRRQTADEKAFLEGIQSVRQ